MSCLRAGKEHAPVPRFRAPQGAALSTLDPSVYNMQVLGLGPSWRKERR